jgi:hypothetical protein
VIHRKLGVREGHVAQELRSANEMQFSLPRSRQVFGVMNDFGYGGEGHLYARHGVETALEASLKLAEMPLSPIAYGSPGRLTIALFENSKRV